MVVADASASDTEDIDALVLHRDDYFDANDNLDVNSEIGVKGVFEHVHQNRNFWGEDEDRTLLDLKRNGGSWEQIATGLGSGRTAKQCQERWTNVVEPSRVKTGWSEDEDKILIEKHAELHGKFAQI